MLFILNETAELRRTPTTATGNATQKSASHTSPAAHRQRSATHQPHSRLLEHSTSAMNASGLDVASYCAIAGLAALNGTSASLPLTVGIIGLLVWQTARDVRKRLFVTGLALALGLALSLAITLPGAVAGSVLDRAQLILPAAILVALFVYGVSFVSVQVSKEANGSRVEQTAALFTFPLLWATSWAIFCRAHSLGRLISWTPLREFGSFYAVTSAFGLPGLDFLIALMAVAVIELLGGLRYAQPETDPLIDIEPHERSQLLSRREQHPSWDISSTRSRRSKLRCILLLSSFFAWWGIAGVTKSNATTEPGFVGGIKIACVLPQAVSRHGRLTLQDYILESDIVSGRGAKILQFPEAAVHLVSTADKVDFVARLATLAARRKAYIGTSYTFQDEQDLERSSILSSMLGPKEEVVYTYAKQALVPVAESYRFAPGREHLPLKSIFVPEPRQRHRAIPLGRNITISTAICHDTSYDHIVRQAHTSSLVLVPSSVYSERVAWTRISQLRANARALSTSFLVCDGNKEGISAFIDQAGDVRYWQKGAGSFEVRASLATQNHTAYGAYGDIGSISILLALTLAFAGVEVLIRQGYTRLSRLYQQAKEAVKHRFQAHYSASSTAVIQDEEDLM